MQLTTIGKTACQARDSHYEIDLDVFLLPWGAEKFMAASSTVRIGANFYGPEMPLLLIESAELAGSASLSLPVCPIEYCHEDVVRISSLFRMDVMRSHRTIPEHSGHSPVLKGDRPLWVRRVFEADLAAVRLISCTAQPTVGRASAVVISKLGNGWLYPILGLIIFEYLGRAGLRVVILAGLNAGFLHCLYPYIKRRIGRPRPFRVDPHLRSLVAVLDEHSFPSGHVMTLSGVLVPIVLVWPTAAISAATLLLVMAWSRIATAHHYPSDILGGALLGIVLACPFSLWFLAVW
jgi:undecaprenyl-diphosphatase